ncbi:disulfide bond formation protein B [Photobacterium damselae]|uniref:disulfide bond formation protein B n=1 Tax=Photobacterium damselae TaxID=38293 RepID=UPI001EEF051F|nr:disulfide bond formation protein B [Photobacterium damselae]UKA04895.1 disulfide bond formation protein B [Photobacterium damselae subsp. damselae]
MKNFLRKLDLLSGTRKGWALALIIPFFALATAMYMQHGLGYKPCYYCILERLVFVGFALISIVGILFGNKRFVGIFLSFVWVVLSKVGVVLVAEHYNKQVHPSLFEQCSMFIKYPSWLPLDRMLPSMFSVQSDCSANIIHFLGMGIPEWLMIVFVISMVGSGVVLYAKVISWIMTLSKTRY